MSWMRSGTSLIQFLRDFLPTLPAQLGQLKTGKGGKGLLQSHLWCPNVLARLWDRKKKNKRKLLTGTG